MGDVSNATYVPPADYQVGAPTNQAVGSSPYTYQNPAGTGGKTVQAFISPGNLGSISLIEYSKDGNVWFGTGMIAGSLVLIPGDYIRITWLAVKPILILSPLF